MSVRILTAIAVADFRERVRRPAYLVILLAAVGLGVLAVPSPTGEWTILDAGGYRGVYNSAYVGTVTALAGALWFSLAGFYVVRNVIGRDESTRVGQLLAATPLPAVGYLLGKFLSNLLVLASMAGVLATTAFALQLLRGESRAVEPVALLAPFVLLALPILAATAALALLFDSIRPVRGGIGNIAWFFLWMVAAIAGQGANAPFGGLGSHRVAESIHASLTAQGAEVGGAEFGLGLMKLDAPLRTVVWSGLDLNWTLVGERLLLLLVAVGLAALPALWFGRFDPARHRRLAAAAPHAPQPAHLPAPQPAHLPAPQPAHLSAVRPGRTLVRLVAGELRILVRGTSRWWWAVTVALTVAALVAPVAAATGPLLLAVGIWPVLIWSRLGTHRPEYGTETLLGAYPAARRQVLAAWLAGLALTALVGLGPALRMVAAVDGPGLAAWLGGVLFIPALALALGTLSRSARLFQVTYVALWYLVVNGVAAVDYVGAIRVGGQPAGPSPLLVAGLAGLLLATALGVGAARHAAR